MSEKIPTRQVMDPYTGQIREVNLKWVRQEGKTPKQILLEIKEVLGERHISYQDAEDLLNEATILIWTNFSDPQNNKLYMDLDEQKDLLGKYHSKRSQKAKNELLHEVIKDAQDSIEIYYSLHDE